MPKQHGIMFRVFTDVQILVADEEKSVEEIQAMGFAEDETRKHFLAWNIRSRAIKGETDNDVLCAELPRQLLHGEFWQVTTQ